MKFLTILFCAFAFWFSIPESADAIKVGVAEIDITPKDSVLLWGYSSRKDPSTGILDPLMAKAVVFDDGKQLASIVVIDAGRTFPQKDLKDLRNTLKQSYNLENVLISATHTHAAPGYYSNETNQKWLKETLSKVGIVVGDAIKNTKEATVKTATGTADLSYDRRVINENGSVKMLWENFDRKFVREVDQKVRTLFIEDLNGNPIVTMVHYACHPVMTGQDNLKISADYPAYMAEVVEKEIGGMCMFVQGATGNINPYLAAIVSEDLEHGVQKMKNEGYSLGECVVALYTQAKPVDSDNLVIHYTSFKLECEPRYPLDDERIKSITEHSFLENPEATHFYPEVSILSLGNEIAWAGFPGEFFDDFQTGLISRSPFKHTFFVGYCNGHYSYFPTIKAAAEGGYGASYSTLTAAGTGEIMVDRAVVNLYKLAGQLESQ